MDQQAFLKRIQADRRIPKVTMEIPQRAKLQRPLTEPPTATSIPIEQFIGLKNESDADLSTNRPPVYPPEAVRRRLEGIVLLRLEITDEGIVERVTLLESSGHRILDEAAINAVAKWRGQPALRWGQPVASTARLPVRFRL